MPHESLKTFLTTVIEVGLSRSETPGIRSPRGRRSFGPQLSPAALIADELINQAIASGLPLTNHQTESSALSGGNTAELVSRLTLHAPFVFKMDRLQQKLAAEGEMMRGVRSNTKLPKRFRDAWPVVYAIRNEPPYAYLMEYFPASEDWQSLEDRLYPQGGGLPASAPEATRLVHAILDILFEGYEASKSTRSLPNLQEDYLSRISGRLAEAAAHDQRFRSQPLLVNGVRMEPWEEYLDLLKRNASFVSSISPRFSTIAHGDPNPGNLILRTTTSSVELKLIDPKEWINGDYLFDIAKLTHFLEATGPIEKPETGAEWKPRYEELSGTAALNYSAAAPSWTKMLVDACLSRVEQFAHRHDDINWQARYELGMASNLLGLPIGRLTHKNPRPDAALALYGEGLKWLARFCDRLQSNARTPAPLISIVDRKFVEPEPIRRARAVVREHLPHAREEEDRRGFQLLHWDSPHIVEGGKPLELSLEHEARLRPASDRVLADLQRALTASDGLAAGKYLLPDDPAHGALIVRRDDRPPGAQSVDRYYDLKDVPRERRLIPRMLSLRERAVASEFMTWAASGERRALNLELPIVAVENTGVVARLEFNWIDDLKRAIAEFTAAGENVAMNPLYLASRVVEFDPGPFEPVIEHTTYREKYMVVEPAGAETKEQQLFQVNIDHVVAQSLKTRRIGTYTDFDIAPSQRVDEAVLQSLIDFAEAIARRFELVPVGASKAWRDASITGELD